MFKGKNGDRQNVANVALLLTDGKSNEPALTKTAATKTKAGGISIIAVGIGDFFFEGASNLKELRDVSSDPDSKFVYTAQGFDSLFNILESIEECACTL